MKNIIIGQLLMWFNLATIIVGWKVMEYLSPPEFVEMLIGLAGLIGTLANLFFSIMMQGRGYSQLKLISLD